MMFLFKINQKTFTLEKLIRYLRKKKILDIGPKSRIKFHNQILNCSSLLWNGPLGFYEEKPFDEGTNFVMKAVK